MQKQRLRVNRVLSVLLRVAASPCPLITCYAANVMDRVS